MMAVSTHGMRQGGTGKAKLQDASLERPALSGRAQIIVRSYQLRASSILIRTRTSLSVAEHDSVFTDLLRGHPMFPD